MNIIYNEDCIITLNRLKDEYIDLTVASPPYNIDLGNNKFNKNKYDVYKDDISYIEYIQWLKEILTLLYQKTKNGGRCVINIGDKSNGKIATHVDVINFMREIGWLQMTTIIWNKQQVGNRTAWGSFQSPSSPSFPTPFEYILVFCKDSYKLKEKGEVNIEKQDFINWSLAIWNIVPEIKMKSYGHPAMFPVEIPLRCIKLFSYKNSIVYDPFMGAGTTAVAAIQSNVYYIGSEISENYCSITEERIKGMSE